jgi:RNA polymerase sigma factor (sigma-70 family)
LIAGVNNWSPLRTVVVGRTDAVPLEDRRICEPEPASEERSRRLAALYQEHVQGLRDLLLGLLRDRTEADEALQQVFLKLLESWDAVQPETAKGWLFTVAYHEAMARRRRRLVDAAALTRLWAKPVWQTGRESADPASSADRSQLQENVRCAVCELPDLQREVVERRMYRDQTFAKIAQEVGCSLNTVLSRMRLALEKLKRRLEDPE